MWIKVTASFPLNTDTAKNRSRATKQPSVGRSRILDLAYQRRGARSPGCGVSQGRNTQTYLAWFWLAGLFQSCLSSSIDRKMCFPLNKWSKFLNQCCWEGGGGVCDCKVWWNGVQSFSFVYHNVNWTYTKDTRQNQKKVARYWLNGSIFPCNVLKLNSSNCCANTAKFTKWQI